MTTTTFCSRLHGKKMEFKAPSQQLCNWFKLLLWVAAILIFIFAAAPWMQQHSSSLRTLSAYIDKSGIDAGAVYYTEVEEVTEADLKIRDTFRFYLDEQD